MLHPTRDVGRPWLAAIPLIAAVEPKRVAAVQQNAIPKIIELKGKERI